MLGRVCVFWCGAALALAIASCGSAKEDGLRGDKTSDAGEGSPGFSGSGGFAAGTGGGTAGTGGQSGGGASGGRSGGPSSGGDGGVASDAGGAGGNGASGSLLAPCQNSLDCADDEMGRTICSPALGLCVECASPNDCSENADCLGNRCVPYQPCQTSLDCALGMVCDSARERCVECVGDADCGDNEVCVASSCATSCDSDNDCTSTGRLCDFSTGACAECLDDGGCDASEFCLSGSCVADVCPADRSVCSGGGISACNSRGDAFLPLAPCAARQTCVDASDGATCEPWVCTAGATECGDPTTAVTCSADGLSIEASTDCSSTDEVCNAGACSDLACSPDADFCEQGTVRHCAADGLSSTLVDTCESTEYCDSADPSCKPLVCTPNADACNGSIATTCNGTGTGYAAGGTDCASSGQSCVAGSCQSCPGGMGPVEDVRLVEVFVGQADYVILRNTNPTCPVDLSALTLSVSDAEGGANLGISAHMLDPGAQVLVAESAATGPVTSALIDLNYTAGHVMLCVGPCTTAGTPTVIDAMSYWDGVTAPPAFPSPVTFSPIQGIDSSNGTTTAFVRSAITGTYPSFAASDWTTGPATQEDPPAGTCPATQPTGICTSFGLTCTYGAVTCTCSILTVTWTCS